MPPHSHDKILKMGYLEGQVRCSKTCVCNINSILPDSFVIVIALTTCFHGAHKFVSWCQFSLQTSWSSSYLLLIPFTPTRADRARVARDLYFTDGISMFCLHHPWPSLGQHVADASPVSSVHTFPDFQGYPFPSVSDCFFSVPFEAFLFFTGLCMLKATDSQSYAYSSHWPFSSHC